MKSLVKRDKTGFTEVGSRYKLYFNRQESALSGTVSLEPRPSHLLRVESIAILNLK